MAMVGEVRHRHPRAGVVVRQHGVGHHTRGPAVDEHDRGPSVHLAGEVRVVPADGGEDEAVDPAPQERLDGLALAGGIVVEARGEDRHVVRACHVLDGAMQGGGEGVGDVAHQEPECVGAAATAQVSRRGGPAGSGARRWRPPPVPECPRPPSDPG